MPGTRSSPLFASIRPPHSRCLAPDPAPCLLASGRPTAGAWHQIQNPVCYTRGTGTRGAAPRHLSTVWRQVASAREPARARCRIVAIGCQAVDSGASKASTVWRQVATAEVPGTDLDPEFASIRPPQNGCLAPGPVPCLLASGPAATDAWYRPRHLFATPEEPARARCRIVAICCQAVDSGASNASTVWRQVATAEEPRLPQRVPTCVVLGVSGF